MRKMNQENNIANSFKIRQISLNVYSYILDKK